MYLNKRKQYSINNKNNCMNDSLQTPIIPSTQKKTKTKNKGTWFTDGVHKPQKSCKYSKHSPPVSVKVANSYSATVNPALLCAVTRKWYQTAGSRSKTTKLPPAFTLFDTWIHSVLVLRKNISNNSKI